MKRFPKASYIRDQLHRLFVTAMLALAALALLGKAAHAQTCGELGDVPSVLLEHYVDAVEEPAEGVDAEADGAHAECERELRDPARVHVPGLN